MEFLQRLTEENVEQLLEFLRVKSFGRDLTLALTALGLVLKILCPEVDIRDQCPIVIIRSSISDNQMNKRTMKSRDKISH